MVKPLIQESRSESLDLKTTSTKQAAIRNGDAASGSPARAIEDYRRRNCPRQNYRRQIYLRQNYLRQNYLRQVTPIRKPIPSATATVASGRCVMASSSVSSIEAAASWAASIIALPRSDMSSTACSALARACL